MNRLTLLAGLAFLVACSGDTVTTPPLTWDGEPLLSTGSNPHFVRASAELDGENLVVSFKEVGLGNNALIDYVASASATATYACRNKGGNFPSDPKKQEVSGPVTAEGTFSSGKNGQITASLTLHPPASDLSCPPGQDRVLADVTYSDVVISDTTNDVSESIPGTFSATFFDL